MNWSGGHWLLLIFDFRNKICGTICFADPLGNDIPARLKRQLKARFPFALVRRLRGRVQYDAIHCGIWCALIAKLYLKHCQLKKKPRCFSLFYFCDVKVNAKPGTGDRERNTSHVLDARQLFRSVLSS